MNSIPPPTLVAMRYGSSFATGIHTRPATTSAWRPLRAVPNVNWAPTTATARGRLALYSLKAPGIHCQLTLWDRSHLSPPQISDRLYRLLFKVYHPHPPPAITPPTQSAKPSCGMLSGTSGLHAGSSLIAAASSSVSYGPSSYARSEYNRSSPHRIIRKATPSTRGATEP